MRKLLLFISILMLNSNFTYANNCFAYCTNDCATVMNDMNTNDYVEVAAPAYAMGVLTALAQEYSLNTSYSYQSIMQDIKNRCNANPYKSYHDVIIEVAMDVLK